MHRVHGISMSIVANRLEVLDKLKKNRDAHRKIVEEAREGYFIESEKVLKAELRKLRKNKGAKFIHISVSLRPPVDHTAEYDTVITMLEYHESGTITLTADEVRQLIEDRWDWMDDFIGANSPYSQTAQAMSSNNG